MTKRYLHIIVAVCLNAKKINWIANSYLRHWRIMVTAIDPLCTEMSWCLNVSAHKMPVPKRSAQKVLLRKKSWNDPNSFGHSKTSFLSWNFKTFFRDDNFYCNWNTFYFGFSSIGLFNWYQVLPPHLFVLTAAQGSCCAIK